MKTFIAVLISLAIASSALAGIDVYEWSEISNDYKANEIAAKQKYAGKAIHIRGNVVSVKEAFGRPVVILGNALTGAYLRFPKGSTGFESLKPGQNIKASAKVTGFFAGSPQLDADSFVVE